MPLGNEERRGRSIYVLARQHDGAVGPGPSFSSGPSHCKSGHEGSRRALLSLNSHHLEMKTLRLLLIIGLCAVGAADIQAADSLTRHEWKMDGVVREGLVYVPAQARTNPTSVVFAFHGHGGS